MNAFEDGQRVRYMGMRGPGLKWNGREGAVQASYRDYDGNRVLVLLDGEKTAWSFDEDDFEAVKETYVIENAAEGFTTAVMELTTSEVALIERMIEQFKDTTDEYAPTMTIKKEQKK